MKGDEKNAVLQLPKLNLFQKNRTRDGTFILLSDYRIEFNQFERFS